jgi:hypothetical protein
MMFLDYLNLDEKSFFKVVDSFRPEHLWKKIKKFKNFKNNFFI